MHCPSCQQGYLKPTKITDGLPALSCNHCRGYLLSMFSYRPWIENNSELLKPEADVEIIEDTSKAITCPKCQRLMAKFRITDTLQNKLDSCGYCGELWVDNGEWKLLLSLGLADKLSTILSMSGQKQIFTKDLRTSLPTTH